MLEIGVVNSSYATSGQGVSQEAVERWRERLSADEIGVVQSVCGPLMGQLGYTLDPAKPSRLRVARAWSTVPFAVARAAVLNRHRLGKATQYVRRRASAAFSRGPL
jgi:hypothetical protein